MGACGIEELNPIYSFEGTSKYGKAIEVDESWCGSYEIVKAGVM